MEKILIIKNTFKIHPFYFFAAFICSITGKFKGFLIFNLIIIIHELGHILTAIILKWKIEKIVILPFGAITIFNEKINRPVKEEFLIAIFGPIFQIVLSICINSETILNYSNALLLFNLLPIWPLDGAKILNLILNKFLSFKKSHLMTIYISFIIILVVIIKSNLNLILTLILSLILTKVIEEYKNHNNIFQKFLLERYMYDLPFKKSKTIKSLNLNKMQRDYRHIFYNGKIYVTEREILKKKFDFTRKTW